MLLSVARDAEGGGLRNWGVDRVVVHPFLGVHAVRRVAQLAWEQLLDGRAEVRRNMLEEVSARTRVFVRPEGVPFFVLRDWAVNGRTATR